MLVLGRSRHARIVGVSVVRWGKVRSFVVCVPLPGCSFAICNRGSGSGGLADENDDH